MRHRWRTFLAWLLQAVDGRDVVLWLGLLLLHLGLRDVQPWAPGAALYVPGLVIAAVAIFGVRGGVEE